MPDPKSSRAQGDLFEALVANEVAGQLHLQQPVPDADIEMLQAKAHTARADSTTSRELDRARDASVRLVPILRERQGKLGRPRAVIWCGRKFHAEKSVADVKVEFEHGCVCTSLKSVTVGRGT